IGCGCFGSTAPTRISWSLVARDVLLAAVALLAAAALPPAMSVAPGLARPVRQFQPLTRSRRFRSQAPLSWVPVCCLTVSAHDGRSAHSGSEWAKYERAVDRRLRRPLGT